MDAELTPDSQTRRAVAAGWGLLLARLCARGYLVFMLALVACAVVPMMFGPTGTVVQSGSMLPHIAVGDVVLASPFDDGAETPMGRVVTFDAPPGSAEPGLRLHRIVGTNPDGSLVTAGDANRSVDSEPLARDDIIAVACLLIPWVGLPTFWLQHGLVLPLIGWILLTVLAFIIEFLASRAETQERRQARSRHARPRRGVPALVRGIGAESAVSILALVICAAMVAVAPVTPAVNGAFTGTTANASSEWVAAVNVVPTNLAFATQPSNGSGGTALATQPAVAIRSAAGGPTTSTANVTLAISNPAGATLSCTVNPVTAVSGTAQFGGCNIDKAGTYTLVASSPGLTSVTSAVTISVGVATHLVFTSTPRNTARNTAFATQPVVAVKDAGGNTVTTSTASVRLALTVSGSAALSNCTANPKNAVAGVAAFTGCRITQAGSYTITATSGTLTLAISAPISIFTSASKLVFVASPSSSTSSTTFAVQPVIAVQDSGGNITSGTNAITLAITTPSGATLGCTANPVSAVNGTATFAGCAIGKSGTYTLRATAGGLSTATSASFTISPGVATRLSFTAAPTSGFRSVAFSTQPVVAVLDAFGNTTTSSASVTLAITTPAGAILTCSSNPKSALSGVATYSGCRIDRAGTYTLSATSPLLTPTVSSTLVVF